jgi:hypothetical protein
MKTFTFAPGALASEYRKNGYVHVKEVVSNEFLDFARQQLARCRTSGQNELGARAIKNKKKQYLFEMPDATFLTDLTEAISALTSLPAAEMTLSERHIMIYDDQASAEPPLHKDRVASEVSVGIPLEVSTEARVALLPDVAKGANLLDGAIYCPRNTSIPARSATAWSLEESEYPKSVSYDGGELVKLDAKPGDLVVFAGSAIYHGRLNGERSAALYFKFNTMGLDPLGEDPATPVRRERGVQISLAKNDEALLQSRVELSPRLRYVNRCYTRPDWTPVLQAAVSGEKDFTLSEDDSDFIMSVRKGRTVKETLMSLGIPEEQQLPHIPRIRRLGRLGAIDFLE